MGKTAKWRNFTKEEIEQFVKASKSYAELARKIGYENPEQGAAYLAAHKMIEELKLDISHFVGQGWNKDNFDYSRFQYGKKIKSHDMLNAIVALRGRKCEICGIEEWQGQPVPLEAHHIDGDELNNVLDNLQLICPNCHALTDNWRGRNIKNHEQKIVSDEEFLQALKSYDNIRQALISLGLSSKGGNYNRAKKTIQNNNIEYGKKNYCIGCGKVISLKSIRCKECEDTLKREKAKNNIPYNREELKELIRNSSFLQIGKENNVSDNTIRKWCVRLNLPYRSNEIKNYSDEEWIVI